MTEATIKSAFHVTGVWPANRHVITADMLAPAKETSQNSFLPIVPATPVRAVAEILQAAIQLQIKDDLSDSEDGSELSARGGNDAEAAENPFLISITEKDIRHPSDASSSAGPGDLSAGDLSSEPPEMMDPPTEPPLPVIPNEIQDAVKRLAESSLECLIRTYQTSPSSSANQPIDINPPSRLTSLAIVPENERERLLYAIAEAYDAENKILRRRVMELQAANILNEAYCKTLRDQLAFKNKEKGKKESGGRLMGDGLPVLLTGDFFMERVEAWEKEQKEKARAKAKRASDKSKRSQELAEWKKKKEERLRSIAEIKERWNTAKGEWAAEKEQWVQDKAAGKPVSSRFGKPQPKRGPLPPPIPKPKAYSILGDSHSEESDADDEEDGGSDRD